MQVKTVSYIWISMMRSKLTFENWNLKLGIAVAYMVACNHRIFENILEKIVFLKIKLEKIAFFKIRLKT